MTKVKLKVDLTRYADGLVEGTEGDTIGAYGMWSRGSDRFVGVKFPGIATLDVLWESLEIIDEDFLKRREEEKQRFKERLKTAYDIKKHVGPRGGFRCLSYSYDGGHVSNYFKDESEQIEKIFKEYGKEIEMVIDD